MLCPRCGTPNPETGYFCRSCGYQLQGAEERITGETKAYPPAEPEARAVPAPAYAPPPPPVAVSGPVAAVLILPTGQEFPINRDELTIGRTSGADLVLQDEHVSRRHARIEVRDGGFYLHDLGSANGTFLNGVRVKEMAPLRDQDVVRIGRAQLTFRVFGAGGVPLSAEARPATVLAARKLSKVYGSGATKVVAVNGVSLEVARGRIELIIGPPGSGKTTLLAMLGCVLRPSAGSLVLLGRSVTEVSDGALAGLRLRQIGFIFKNPNLVPSLSLLDNVAFPLNLAGVRGRRARDRARGLLGRVGLADRAKLRPDRLSIADQQRVAIARALANEPALVLADEPTACLDSKGGHAVVEMLYRIAKEEDRTVIIASSDPRLRDIADRVLGLEDGQLTLSGSG